MQRMQQATVDIIYPARPKADVPHTAYCSRYHCQYAVVLMIVSIDIYVR